MAMGSKQTPGWLLLACPGLLEEEPIAEHQASLQALLLLGSVIGSLGPRNLTKGRGGYSRLAPSLPLKGTGGFCVFCQRLGPVRRSGQCDW